MWLMLLPLIIAEAAFWLFLTFAAWRAFKAISAGSLSAMTFWLAIIALPFVVQFVLRHNADVREEQRAAEVAGFARTDLASPYPRVLEIHGYVTTAELMIFLDTLDIDEIVMFQSRAFQGTYRAQHFTLAEHCRGRGREQLQVIAGNGRLRSVRNAKDSCLHEHQSSVDANRHATPALVFLIGGATTLKMPGAIWAGGHYEARVRTSDQDLLLDYWERPFITRPAGPSPWWYAFPGNSDWKRYRNPGRVKFFAAAVGLLPRAVASAK